MKHLRRAGLLALCVCAPLLAQEQPAKLTPAQELYRAAIKDLTAARQALIKQFQAAATTDEKQAIQRQIVGLMVKTSDRFFKIAADHAGDPGAEESLAFVANLLGIDATSEPTGARAFGLLVANFPQSKRIGPILQSAKWASTADL